MMNKVTKVEIFNRKWVNRLSRLTRPAVYQSPTYNMAHTGNSDAFIW